MSDIRTVNGVKINFAIPHTMTAAGLEYLGRMAQTVPENGLIVEIGPLFGSSSWVLAQNSKPSVKVISVDTWEPAKWIDRIESEFPGCRPFSKETFEYYVSDCDNVTAVQGWSPQIVESMDLQNIDMFFDDATHGDPGFSESMAYYIPRVRTGGIVCGDDYAGGWPDIVMRVDEIGAKWRREAEVSGRVWSLIKPEVEGTPAAMVGERLNPVDNPVVVKTRHVSGVERESSPSCWAGALHKGDAITALCVAQAPAASPSDLQVRLHFSDGTSSAWVSEHTWCSAAPGATVTGLQVRVEGDEDKQRRLRYQLNLFDVSRSKGGNSKDFPAEAMAATSGSGELVSAVRIHFL